MILFYDWEIFKYDNLVVIIDPVKREEFIFVNDREGFVKFYNEHKKDIWVGYNNVHYDQYITKAIILGFDPKKVNDFIIRDHNDGWKYSSLFRKVPMINYDTQMNGDKGLKSLEGFMGNNIKESDVPFDIDRKLTSEEIADTIKYCRHDVQETIKVFMRRIDEFNTSMYFIKHFGYPLDDLAKTKAQLGAKMLGGNRKGKTFKDEFNYPIVSCLRLEKYKSVAEWYKNPDNHSYAKSQDEVMVAGVPHKFSWGGGHGAIKKYHSTGVFVIVDVTAYYPSEQEKFKFGYRVMNNPENFEFIHNSNIEFKKKGDKKARLPFKIMDNALSGQMKQKSSPLYDPMSNNSICINGQLLLLDLVEHLEPHCKLVQNNTDGIILELKNYERDYPIIKSVVAEWESRTGLEMGFDVFEGEIFQKDVNNYLLIDRKTGAVKAKGGYVKNLSDLDYDLPILNKALNQYMRYGIPVEETIMNCDDLKEFQLICKISKKYTHIEYGGVPIKEKCIRVFASKDKSDLGVKKIHAVTGRPAKLQNSPDHCFIYNDSVNGVKVVDKLDKAWYITKAKKRLDDFGVRV